MSPVVTAPMAILPLFYRTVVPLDREAHRTWQLVQPQRFGFARGTHLVPAVVDEFGSACRHLPILFLPESHGPTPVFLTGLVPGRCAVIDAAGAWTGRYLPAYLRRFPFILGEADDLPPLVCFDDTSDAIRLEADEAEPSAHARLFEADGGDTPLLAERVRLVVEYAEAARRTAAFGRTLQDLGLLRALTVQGRDPATGQAHALHGVLGLDEAMLADLPDEGFARLRREGWLAAIHAHLVSLQSVADFILPFASPQPSNPAPAARHQDPAA